MKLNLFILMINTALDDEEMYFVKFPKIYENTNNYKPSKKIEWIATEKIDGSNFSVYSDGKQTKFAKRTAFIEMEDWFFNYQKISLDLSNKAKKIYEIFSQKEPNLHFIVIYGELCGGWYPSDSEISSWEGPIPSRINEKGLVKIPLEKRAIQEGIYYNRNIALIVFDIALVKKDKSLLYLEYNEMENICKEVNLYYTPILIKGKLKTLLDYSLEFNSTIPKMFGLKELKHNTAEGIVIRPSIWNSAEERPVLKRKNKKFKQNSGEFDMNAVMKNPFLCSNCLINLNRLYGVISKVGARASKDEICEEFVKDVWDELNEYRTIIVNYDEVDKYIHDNVEVMVDEYLKGI